MPIPPKKRGATHIRLACKQKSSGRANQVANFGDWIKQVAIRFGRFLGPVDGCEIRFRSHCSGPGFGFQRTQRNRPFSRVPLNKRLTHTVDGRNPAPRGNHGKPLFIGIYRGFIIPGFLRWCNPAESYGVNRPKLVIRGGRGSREGSGGFRSEANHFLKTDRPQMLPCECVMGFETVSSHEGAVARTGQKPAPGTCSSPCFPLFCSVRMILACPLLEGRSRVPCVHMWSPTLKTVHKIYKQSDICCRVRKRRCACCVVRVRFELRDEMCSWREMLDASVLEVLGFGQETLSIK